MAKNPAPTPEQVAEKIVGWFLSCGRLCLSIDGIIVAAEGDMCRDSGRVWTGEEIKRVAGVASAAIAQALASKVQAWQDIKLAPKDGTEIVGLCDIGGRKVCHVIHWAEGGGEDQPRFGPEWFYWNGALFMDTKPLGWVPMPAAQQALDAARA